MNMARYRFNDSDFVMVHSQSEANNIKMIFHYYELNNDKPTPKNAFGFVINSPKKEETGRALCSWTNSKGIREQDFFDSDKLVPWNED